MLANEARIKQRLEYLAQLTSTPGQGTTRMSYSTEAQKARAYLKQEMTAIGLKVWEDAIGNVFGRLEGTEDLPPVVIGSHFDSVPHGGPFDGPAGVIAALEVANCFFDQQLKPRYPLEVVALVEEEGASFGAGLLASRAMIGKVSPQDLAQLKDRSGISAEKRMLEAGYHPQKIQSLARKKGDIKAFLELHIEQGPVLENARKDVGLVDVIVGICQLEVIVKGKAGHAGTTPMDQRADALLATSALIQKVAQLAIDAGEGTVATVGQLFVYPNGSNIIPDRISFTVDIRSKNEDKLRWVNEQVKNAVQQAQKQNITTSVEEKLFVLPTLLNPIIHQRLIENSKKLGLNYQTMVSGAGHDTMIFSQITDAGLIFVPSKAGLSHHPDEWTDYNQIKSGADLMFETVKILTEVNEND